MSSTTGSRLTFPLSIRRAAATNDVLGIATQPPHTGSELLANYTQNGGGGVTGIGGTPSIGATTTVYNLPGLLTIARNECRSHLRRKWLRQLVFLDAARDEGPPTPSVEPLALQLERDRLVRRALAQLPEKFRVPLTLRVVEQLDYDEVARVIGRTESAARSRIHYGLKALAEHLPQELRDDYQ